MNDMDLYKLRPTLQPGQPCSHSGCASHLSHPCEGCGRYAAGTANGPDVEYARRHIERLAAKDRILSTFIMMGQQNEWTWEQTLCAIVIKFQDELKRDISGIAEMEHRRWLRRYIDRAMWLK